MNQTTEQILQDSGVKLELKEEPAEMNLSQYENHVEQTVLSDQSMGEDVPDNFMSAEEEAALLMEYDMQRAGFDMSDMCMEG